MSDMLLQKLSEILVLDLDIVKHSDTSATINEYEELMDVTLPCSYKSFLIKYGACMVKDDYYFKAIETMPITFDDDFYQMDIFYGVSDGEYDWLSAVKSNRDMIGVDVIPIGDTAGGDLICLGVTPENHGNIYYWDHENEIEYSDGSQIFYLIAESFDTFIMSFIQCESDDSTEGSYGEITLSPKLLELLKKGNY